MRITASQALERLQPQGKRKAKGAKALQHIATYGYAEDDLFVFGNAEGGILTPADDELTPVIGTWEGEGEGMPPALSDWLDVYVSEVEWWQNIGRKLGEIDCDGSADLTEWKSVQPLIKSKWAQGKPYNMRMTFDGQQCVAGCVPVAIGQIMLYWARKGYKRGCLATQAYTTKTNHYKLDALPPVTVFDYANMTNGKPTTDKQKTAVVDLLEHIGRAVRANYTPNGTSATRGVYDEAMRTSLRLGSRIGRVYASKGEVAFEDAIKTQLMAGQPVMISGSGATGGHSFICDGYDLSTNLYHMNWGWGGKYNGYFALTALNPSAAYAYNSSRSAVINICPEYVLGDVNGDGKVDIADYSQAIQAIQGGKALEQADINSDGKVTITDAQLIINHILGGGEL